MLACVIAKAAPWIDPGDARLRHDLQLLADAGLLKSPLTTWPLSWGDISRSLSPPSNPYSQSPAVLAALYRVQKRILKEASNRVTGHMRLAASGENPSFRTFSEAPREDAEAELGVEWMGKRFAYRLQAAGVKDPADDKEARWDGSYAGVALGNWMLSAGAVDRWWGPGWEGSLILSTNARPVPAVTIQRNNSDPFKSFLLRWIGPWQFTYFMGRLEENRDVPGAKLIGARLNFKPTNNLEIGLARTAQWGGEGRIENFDSFRDLVLGKDNVGQRGVSAQTEPGNQLAGYDARWVSPLFNLPYAVYAQAIGEDAKENHMPKMHMMQAGFEVWGSAPRLAASYRVHIEFSDTRAGSKAEGFYNTAYNHGIYRDGYRYFRRSLGHAMDNDGLMRSLGMLWATRRGHAWALLVRQTKLNRDGTGLNTVSADARTVRSLELSNNLVLGQHTLSWGAAVHRTEIEAGGAGDKDSHMFLQWRAEL